MRWVISQKNHDYITSNIFLRLALEQKYKDVVSIYRLQLYNYLILKEKEKILNTFDKIITSKEKPDFSDLLLATYYNIINGKTEKALVLTNTWLKFYPEQEDFYWFKGWLKIEEWELDEALELLNKAKEINNRNALVILNLWRISKIRYEKDWKLFHKVKAKFLFKKAYELDSAEIGELAKKFLKELNKKNIIKKV
jgi:tetratricopeptide (TPR) repeat protein